MGAKYRHEFKYLLDACDAAIIKTRMQALLRIDPHAGEDGKYLINSLYFDDLHDTCYYENEDGVDYRNKYRIRYYGQDTSYISLEKKSKIHGMTSKTGVVINREICESLIHRSIPEITEKMDEKLSLLLSDIKVRNLIPKVIVSYERTAYIYDVGNVRITFDEKVTSSGDISSFLYPVKEERPVYPVGMSLLEVKWDNVMPSFIKEAINTNELLWSAFSKYYQSRRLNTFGGIKT